MPKSKYYRHIFYKTYITTHFLLRYKWFCDIVISYLRGWINDNGTKLNNKNNFVYIRLINYFLLVLDYSGKIGFELCDFWVKSFENL